MVSHVPGCERAPSRLGHLALPLRLSLVLTVLVVTIQATPTMARWTDPASVTGTSVSTGTLASPTSVIVTQTCVADPTPVRRPHPGGTSTAVSSTSTLTVTRPSGAAVGDVLIAAVVARGNYDTAAPTAPAGWSFVGKAAGFSMGQFVYTRVMSASEPASYDWSGISGNSLGGIAAYSGVDTVTPVNTAAGQLSFTAPSVTTTRDNTMLIGFFSSTTSSPVTGPTEMSPVWNQVTNNGGASLQVATQVSEESWPTAGASGARTATGSGSSPASQLVALQPPLKPRATVTWTPSTSTYATAQQFQLTIAGASQPSEVLTAGAATKSLGVVTTATSYTATISSTYENWVSQPATAAFNGRSC